MHTHATYINIHTRTHTRTHTSMLTHACTNARANTHARARARTHTHTHTHTPRRVCKAFFFPRRFCSFPPPSLKFSIFIIAVLARFIFLFYSLAYQHCFAASHYKHFRTPDSRSALQTRNDTIFIFCIARLLKFRIALLLRGIFGPEIRAGLLPTCKLLAYSSVALLVY